MYITYLYIEEDAHLVLIIWNSFEIGIRKRNIIRTIVKNKLKQKYKYIRH